MMAIDWEKCSSTKFSIFATYNAKLSERFVNMTVILYSIAAILTGTKIFIKHMDSGNASNVSTRLLIVEMDLPFDTNQRFVYESVIIIQFFHLFLCSNVMGVFNALLINLILHIGGQIDILRESLIGIIPKKDRDSSNHFTIKEIIKKHQKIITFSEHIEHLYSYIAMVLFVSDILIICCLGSTIVASIGRPDVLKNIIRVVLFYFVMNMEAFVFCFAGEYLSAKIIKTSGSYISILLAMC
ncbi:PREDICTED: uncharacterized protein LOC105152448 [Acromyrmex echinatior]|uniref:uncharacterized protein LOC105152448 n=1 Tax=Acromyrmex echinatior TaxID=103372 RepID=UPI0005810C45|nr:PREDICTED: uncharacterized protein LOC105152448 [Acromyrmex echinatior]